MSAALRTASPNAPGVPASVAVPIAEMLAIVREYVDESRFDAADRLLGHVLAGAPRQGEALHLSGFVAFKRGRIEQAAALMEQALVSGANGARQLCNLAEVYRLLGRIEEGLAAIRRAAALAPSDAVCHFNEAMLHYERLDTEACIRASRRAIALRPDMPEAHMRLGQTLLLTERFEEGWEEYEWRYRIAGAQPLMPAQFVARFARPQWDGAPLAPGQKLLLIGDQGFGDVVMFARYLPWVSAQLSGHAAEIVVACSAEMAPLLSRIFPEPAYHVRWDDVPDHACYCPFSGLPRLARRFRPDARAGATAAPPYMRPDPERLLAMQAWLGARVPARHRRIGLAWAGRPTHNNDRNRSVPLAALAPLAGLADTDFVSMQKGPSARQVASWPGPAPLHDAESLLLNFEDTAALVAALDLVICVDTSLGHVAGAMDRPAWIMLPYAPDWRWLTGRTDSPWYPSLRLYRQPAPKSWGPVIERILAELRG